MDLFSIAYSALVSLDDKVVIYGGYEKLPEIAVQTVAAFSDGTWTKIGNQWDRWCFAANLKGTCRIWVFNHDSL